MDSIILYIKESYNELLNKVTWPTWSELQSATVLVLVASIIISLVIFLMDNLSNVVLQNTVYS